MIDNVKLKLTPIIEANSYEVVDITFEKQFGTDTLTVFIYKKGGVSLTDCEKVNDLVAPIIDELDPTNGMPYNLNISSPGLDRPIVTDDDLRRAMDEDVEVLLKKADDDGIKKTHGKLSSYSSDTLMLITENGQKEIKRENIKKLQLYIKF